jgi:protein TonB
LEGVVLVRAAIAISGAVSHVDVIESSGYELLDEAAREAVRTASFHAGRVGTVAHAMNVDIRLVFRLE